MEGSDMKITASWAISKPVGLRRIALLTLGSLFVSTQLQAADYTYVRISVPGSEETWATGINARGDIVGVYFTAGVRHGYLLRKGVYTTLPFPEGAVAFGARAINARGDIVGTFDTSDGAMHGYLLKDGQYTAFDHPGSSTTSAFGLNNADDIVGVWEDGGFVLRDGKFRNVPSGGERGVLYNVLDVRDNGRVFVGAAIGPSGLSGFISRRHGEIELISHPDAPGCTAIRGTNERGDVVGVFDTDGCDAPFGAQGFLFRDGEFTVIDFPGGSGSDAFGINDDGVIVGRYVDRSGAIRGFKAKRNSN
jgi:probable HAF family extracellular repeat protein